MSFVMFYHVLSCFTKNFTIIYLQFDDSIKHNWSTCSNMVKHGLQFPNVLTWLIMVTNDLQTWSNIVKVVKHNRYGLSLSNWLELDVYCFVSLCLSMFAHVWSCSKNMFNHDWTCLNMFGNYVWPSSNMVNHS